MNEYLKIEKATEISKKYVMTGTREISIRNNCHQKVTLKLNNSKKKWNFNIKEISRALRTLSSTKRYIFA